MKKFAVLAIAILGFQSTPILAQDGNSPINVDVKGNREVERAYRIGGLPQIVDTTIPAPEVDYPKLSLLYNSDITVDSIQSAEVKIVDKLPQIYRSYAKLGIGTEFMPLGEFYYNNIRSRKYHYGVHLNHLSSFGNLNGYAPAAFDRNGVDLFGKIIKGKSDLSGSINLRNDGFNYYGFQNDSISKDSIAQRYISAGGSVDYALHKRDSGHFNPRMGGTYNYFSTAKPIEADLSDWRTQENYIHVRGGGSYLAGKNLLDVALSIEHNRYGFGLPDSTNGLDSGLVNNNTLISLKPTLTTHSLDNKLKAMGGVDITINAADETRPYVYFLGEVKYSLFNNIFIPYAGVRGGMTQNSFRRMANTNQFIAPNIELRNEHKAIEFYGGIKGTVSKQVGFNLNVEFAHIKDFALFVIDSSSARMNQFNVIYDTLNRSKLEGSVYFQLKEKLKIDLIGRYYSYILLNNSYAWHMPLAQLTLRGRYNLFDKIVAQADASVYAGRKALAYAPGTDITLENGQYVQRLEDIVDFNLSIEYLYSKRMSAFVQFNNVAAQNYQRWHNYPVQAFQVLGGLSFRF